MKTAMICLFLALSLESKGSSLFLPDSDTAALLMLVSNTASTVSNTLKILEVAEKTNAKMDKYHFIAMRKYFIARRVEQHARDVLETRKMKPKNLREINYALARLKMNLKGLKSNIDLPKDIYIADDFVRRYWSKLAHSLHDEKEAHGQELSAQAKAVRRSMCKTPP